MQTIAKVIEFSIHILEKRMHIILVAKAMINLQPIWLQLNPNKNPELSFVLSEIHNKGWLIMCAKLRYAQIDNAMAKLM